MKATSWLLLLYSLPTNRNTERVAVWRRLKKMGAVQIKTSTYLLPDQPAQYEQFQWLAKQIRDFGGDSTLVRAQEIEGLTKEKVVSLFNAARDKEYVELRKALQNFVARRKKSDAEFAVTELERLSPGQILHGQHRRAPDGRGTQNDGERSRSAHRNCGRLRVSESSRIKLR